MDEKKAINPELKARLQAEFEKIWRKELRKAIPVKERMKIVDMDPALAATCPSASRRSETRTSGR